jgi:hypothetical protein
MTTFNWKKLLPHIIAVVLFALIAIIYCNPALQGKMVGANDVTQWNAMAHQIQQYKDVHGEYPLWSNSMFSGMPAFQIIMESHYLVPVSIFPKIFTLFLPKPISFFFLLCISLYFLCLVLRINPWIAMIAGLAYAYASFSAILVVAGHETEIQAMGYVPFLLGSLLLLYEGKYLWGTALTALFSFLLIVCNHFQITYYAIIVAGFMTIRYLIEWIKQRQFKHLVICAVLALVAGGLGVMSNATSLLTTYDFSKETMRGGALTLDTAGNKAIKSQGLDVDYAFRWSYGTTESLSLISPNIYGGSSSEPLAQDGHLANALGEKQIPQQLAQNIYQVFPAYWGDQPGTTNVYIGAVMCFLFIFSLIYVRNTHKWWIASVAILGVVMAWGKNFPAFNDFLFYHLPMYNKFRVPTMAMYLPQLCVPLMVGLGLQQLFYGQDDAVYLWKKFKVSLIVTGALVLILAFLYTSLSYKSAHDTQIQEQLNQMSKNDPTLGQSIVKAAAQDRQSLYGSDLLRTIIYILLAVGVLFLYIKKKIKVPVALAAIGLLVFIDLISVDLRYLTSDNFKDPEEASAAYNPSPADQEIMKDPGYYRVLNLAADTWNDALPSYFHNSIGGYNAAKLSLYQDLITYQIGNGPNQNNMQVFNMLNTKYIIFANRQNGQLQVSPNPGALGPCWFVSTIEYVPGPAEAMKALSHFNPKDTAIVEQESKSAIPFTPEHDTTGSIRMLKNDNDLITYESSSKSNEFAVFSEIYYSRGWKAYIDGKESPIIKTNYLLRGLAVPAGQHQIKFEFKPSAYYTGNKLTSLGSLLIVLLLIGAAIMQYRRGQKAATLKP